MRLGLRYEQDRPLHARDARQDQGGSQDGPAPGTLTGS
jgi:hypothetical protein